MSQSPAHPASCYEVEALSVLPPVDNALFDALFCTPLILHTRVLTIAQSHHSF